MAELPRPKAVILKLRIQNLVYDSWKEIEREEAQRKEYEEICGAPYPRYDQDTYQPQYEQTPENYDFYNNNHTMEHNVEQSSQFPCSVYVILHLDTFVLSVASR